MAQPAQPPPYVPFNADSYYSYAADKPCPVDRTSSQQRPSSSSLETGPQTPKPPTSPNSEAESLPIPVESEIQSSQDRADLIWKIPVESNAEDLEKLVSTQQGQQQGLQQPQSGPGQEPTLVAHAYYKDAVPLANLNMNPAPIDCPVCKRRALTKTQTVVSNTQHAWAVATTSITLFGGFVPYLMNNLKDVKHSCGNCDAALAKWHKSGKVDILVPS